MNENEKNKISFFSVEFQLKSRINIYCLSVDQLISHKFFFFHFVYIFLAYDSYKGRIKSSIHVHDHTLHTRTHTHIHTRTQSLQKSDETWRRCTSSSVWESKYFSVIPNEWKKIHDKTNRMWIVMTGWMVFGFVLESNMLLFVNWNNNPSKYIEWFCYMKSIISRKRRK